MGKVAPRYFTMEELQKFDGKSGGPTYLVFKGKVYDISNSQLWVNGTHMDVHESREDLEETIKAAPHGEEVLERFPMIGEVREGVPIPAAEVTKQTTTAAPVPAPTSPIAPKPEAKGEAGEAVMPKEAPTSMPRRDFLKLAITAGGVITAAALISSLGSLTFVPPSSIPSSWPNILVTNASQLTDLVPMIFYYPLTSTPNILVKLGVAAEGGVGPNSDIVAFSGICQHLGCYPGFQAPGTHPPCNSSYTAAIPMAYCCCHGSQYDFVHGAKVIGGPAPRPLPQVTLQYDSSNGDIYATAMGPPNIFGHGPPGTTNPTLVMKYDLTGGTIVSG